MHDSIYLIAVLLLGGTLIFLGYSMLKYVTVQIQILFPELSERLGGSTGMRRIILGIILACFIVVFYL